MVKIYRWYYALSKRFGLKSKRQHLLSVVFNQKLVHFLVIILTISLIFINLTAKTKAGALTNDYHKTMLSDLTKSELSGFEEDEQYVVEPFNVEAVTVQQSYLDNSSVMQPQARASLREDTSNTEELIPTIQEGSTLVKPELASTQISKKPRKETIEYVVRPGDTVSTIAQKFEISVSTILWENNLSSYSIIRPGDKLSILPTSGINHKIVKGDTIKSIAKKYGVEEDTILEANKIDKDDKLEIGKKLFIVGGKKMNYPSYQPKTYTGFAAIKNLVSTPNSPPAPGNKMNWPTVGHRITQYYSWRHHGLDIANKIGTPIYAADSGVVEYAGWGTGYGNHIDLNHGGGKKTRYAHLSAFDVKKGDKVSKGQIIGRMGSTGWSTGPHLHFEVMINNKKYNPLNYIK